jgi:hypothetical protein
MIEESDIFARISHKDQMLSFLDDPNDYDTSEVTHSESRKMVKMVLNVMMVVTMMVIVMVIMFFDNRNSTEVYLYIT